jgi:hypothetical protein
MRLSNVRGIAAGALHNVAARPPRGNPFVGYGSTLDGRRVGGWRRRAPENEEDDHAEDEQAEDGADEDGDAGWRLEEATHDRRERRVDGDEEVKDRDLGDTEADQNADRRVVAPSPAATRVEVLTAHARIPIEDVVFA